ncbi:MAG: UbiA family prenyltransferase [Actinomycetota bacterium]
MENVKYRIDRLACASGSVSTNNWTPPHFWALAIKYEDDYAAASVPMMPVVAGHRKTATQIVVYSVVVWALTLGLWTVAQVGWLYLAVAMVLGILFTGGAVRRPSVRAQTTTE